MARVAPANDALPEIELVARAKQDPREFAALYSRYLDPIHQHCYRRLGSRELAEDATSQVFTKALTALPQFQPRGDSIRGWLFTIANHVLADYYRSARPQSPLDRAAEITDSHPSPEEQAVATETSQALREAMTSLSDRQRQVVELRLAGLTAPEIAQVLGCRVNSVNVAQFRAVSSLRTLMGVSVQRKGGRDA